MTIESKTKRHAVLMIAYTYYQTDPRVVREAEAAVSGGFEVDFLALRRGNDPPVETLRGVRVFHLNQSRYRGGTYASYLTAYLLFFLRCFFKTTALHMRHRYKVIHVNNMPDFMVFCTVIAKALGAKVILDIHDPMPNTFASKFRTKDGGLFYRLLLWQELLSVWYSDRVLTVHEPVKEGVLVKHGLPADSIKVIANFPDQELFVQREKYDINGQIKLVYHGTIHERSGLGRLALALSKMQYRSKIRVKIIGEGDFSGPLKKLISDNNLSDIVEFDNQSFPVREIPDRIADCNVGIAPLEVSSITNYALPLKLVEYVAMGLPVITVRSAAIRYYFAEEDCMFYDWDDIQSLAALLDRLVQNPEQLLQYRQRSVALRDRFSWSGEKQKYISLLKELLPKSSLKEEGRTDASPVTRSEGAVRRNSN